jgi:hypothetical protein
MDKKILVEQIKRVVNSFKNEDKTFSFIGLIPVYPNNEHTSYILSVSANWLEPFTTNQSISIITKRLFDVLDSKTLQFINRVEICNKNDLHRISNDLILEDSIGYRDFYSDLLTQRHLMSYMVQ